MDSTATRKWDHFLGRTSQLLTDVARKQSARVRPSDTFPVTIGQRQLAWGSPHVAARSMALYVGLCAT
jgi:hypothetical protein